MGYSWHPLERLGPPFLLVDETIFVVPRNSAVHLARHHFKFLFVLDGHIEHEIDGLPGRHPLEPGDVLVAPLVRHHSYFNPDRRKAAPVHVVRFFLDPTTLADHTRRRTRQPEADLTDFVLHHFPTPTRIPGGIDSEITSFLNALRREALERRAGFRHRARAICTEAIVAVARRLDHDQPTPAAASGRRASHATPPIVAGAKEYILKHLNGPLRLGEIAWHVGKGEEHLARVFKRETGHSVFDYVRESRVDRARTLLLDPALSLTEISDRCGFQSAAYFSRTFRKLAGTSPSAYRQSMAATISPIRPRA